MGGRERNHQARQTVHGWLLAAVCLFGPGGEAPPARGETGAAGAPAVPFAHADISAVRSSAPAPAAPAPSTNAFLVVLVDAVGLDYSTPETFLATLRKHPRGGKGERSVGHSWLILGGPLTWLECGHTGDFDADHPYYSDSVGTALRRGDPNPLACLWTNHGVGRYEVGSGGHQPTAAVRFNLTSEQHQAVSAFIHAYDFSRFGMRDQLCTHFVTGAAACAGITLGHQLALTLPQHTRYRGRSVLWWTDPAFSRLTLGSPDVLEKSLRLAIQQGLGRDVLRDYRK